MIKTKLSVIILIAGAFLLSCGNKHLRYIKWFFAYTNPESLAELK